MSFIRYEEGQGLVEYGLVLILIAVAIAFFMVLLGQQVGQLYSRVADVFN